MQAANFCLYDVFRRRLTSGRPSEASVTQRFMAGACAGAPQSAERLLALA